MPVRPEKDKYFMEIAKLVASRSTCLRKHHGAVITMDGHVVSTGYNGAPSHIPHCESCYREEQGVKPGTRYELCRSVHAEMNAIIQAARYGVRVESGRMYVTGIPCLMCARAIINAGLSSVFFLHSERYGEESIQLLDRAGITIWEMTE